MEILFILIALVCGTSTVGIMPELKHNVLRFGYGVNFRYEGMLSHSFDRFYIVTKLEIPKVSDLNLTLFQFDYNCSHVVILIGVMFLTIEKLYKMPIFRKYWYSNTIEIMFLSNIKSYIPIKLCKTSGSIHLFKLMESISRENVTLHRNTIWDIMEIDWRNITVTLNGSVVNLPDSVIIPFRDKFKIRQMMRSRPLLLYLMLKQGQTWYPLSNIQEIMENENNAPESIEMCIGP